MNRLFEIKQKLPVGYENLRSSIEGETIQRIQFDLTNEITLDIAKDLQEFFGNYFQSFNLSMDFSRNNITVQRK